MSWLPHRNVCLGVVLAWGLASGNARGSEPLPRRDAQASGAIPTPVTGLLGNVSDVFTRWENLTMFAAAGVGTVVVVATGLDHQVHVFFHEDLQAPGWGQAANFAGYSLPVAFPLALYGAAAITNENDLWGAAAATTQALGLTLALTGLLKVATGRPFPTHGEDPRDPTRFQHEEYSREFKPFGGAWAWPSGHTAVTICIAATLTGYYPDRLWIPLMAYPVAIAVGTGMVAGEYHWASDVLAGALIAQAIGYTVGRGFRERVRSASREPTGIHTVPGLDSLVLVPVVGSAYSGLMLGTQF